MEELKVTFYLKKNEERADGTVPVLGRIRIGKSMVQFSTKVYVIPALWNVKSGRAVGKSKQAAATNWHKFVKQQEKEQLDKIISEENLKPKETYEFVSQSFKNGEIEETGTAITRILPPIPLFSKNKENDRGKKKKSVISKLKAFFERFFDVSGGTFNQ